MDTERNASLNKNEENNEKTIIALGLLAISKYEALYDNGTKMRYFRLCHCSFQLQPKHA